MLDEERVRLMTRLALYEQTQGKEDFKIIISAIRFSYSWICSHVLKAFGGFGGDIMLENIPSQSIMTELLGQSLYEVLFAIRLSFNGQ